MMPTALVAQIRKLFRETPLATSASVGPPAVRRHVANVHTAVPSTYLHLLAELAGDPSDFYVGHLE